MRAVWLVSALCALTNAVVTVRVRASATTSLLWRLAVRLNVLLDNPVGPLPGFIRHREAALVLALEAV